MEMREIINHVESTQFAQYTGCIISASIGHGFSVEIIHFLGCYDGRFRRFVNNAGTYSPTEDYQTDLQKLPELQNLSLDLQYDGKISKDIQILAFPDGQLFQDRATGTIYVKHNDSIVVKDTSSDFWKSRDNAPEIGQVLSLTHTSSGIRRGNPLDVI
jgi:hypothetical protein